MEKTIKIGDRKFINMTKEELIKIALLELCTPSLTYWNEPLIIDFNNSMFRDTLFIDYYSTRIKDGLESDKICFFLNFKEFTFHYTRSNDDNKNIRPGKRLSIPTIKYLINQNFDIPIY